MAKTYLTGWGCRVAVTRTGGNDGVHVAAQSFDGSIIVENWYNDKDELVVRVDTSKRSSCYGDSYHCFTGSIEEFNDLLQLARDIKERKVSIVRHRDKTKKHARQLSCLGFSNAEVAEKLGLTTSEVEKLLKR